MKNRALALLFAPLFALGIAACDVQQEEEAEMPEVEEGEMPEYEVEPGEVEVRPDTEEVRVPEVEVEEPNGNNRR